MDPNYRKSEVPEGTSGLWRIKRFDYESASDASSNKAPIDTRPEGFRTPSGRYTRLRRGTETFMTDLYEEWSTQRIAIEEAKARGGNILISGLGIGLIVECILAPIEGAAPVEQVTVVELDADVARLTAPYLKERYDGRVSVVVDDIFRWSPPPGAHYSVGWHDIWPNPHDPERWHEMDQIEQRFAPVCDWQGSWCREFLRMERGD